MLKEAIESLQGTVEEKLAALEEAMKSQTSSLETKLDAIETAVENGVSDAKEQRALIQKAVESLAGTEAEKLAKIEQAITSQTTTLSSKLAAIETACKNGASDEATALEAIKTAIETSGTTTAEKLTALEQAIGGQTTDLTTKLVAIQQAVTGGVADVTDALALVKTAVEAIPGSLTSLDTDLSAKIAEVLTAIGAVNTTLTTGAVATALSNILDAITGQTDYSDILTTILEVLEVLVPKEINGHAYVEMGDGLKWATCNIGAENPWDYGGYYAWGETATKESYAWTNYIFAKDPSDYSSGVKKYSEEDSYKTLFPEDDAATSLWKDPWRMPTVEEWAVLRDATLYTWKWETNYNGSGKNGMLVTRKEGTGPCAGNSIFLPAAGRWFESQWLYWGSQGFYWSSSLDSDLFAKGVEVLDSGFRWLTADRYAGLNVRPVTE